MPSDANPEYGGPGGTSQPSATLPTWEPPSQDTNPQLALFLFLLFASPRG